MSRRKPQLSEPGPPFSPLPKSGETTSINWRWILPLIVLCYIGLALFHAVKVPGGATGYQNAPDEQAHVTYVQTVLKGHLPDRDGSAQDPAGYEWHQPPLYYLLCAMASGGGLLGMRLVSILCGAISLLLIFRAARLLIPSDPNLALIATAFAGLLPTHIAITSTVNNDALLELLVSLTVLLLLHSIHSGLTINRGLCIGAAVGAAILTKATGILLIPVVLSTAYLCIRAGEKPKEALQALGVAAGASLAVCGWWLVRNFTLYHELLPLRAFAQAFGGTAQASQMAEQFGGWGAYWQIVLLWTYKSFWAVYGTADSARRGGLPLFLPDPIYQVLSLLGITAIVGLVRGHLRRSIDYSALQRAGITTLFITLFLIALSFASFLTKYFQTQGRYLYPAMLPISLLFALGWQSAIPARYRTLGYLLFGIIMGASVTIYLRFIAFA